LDKEDFNLEVDRNRLTISAEKTHREEVNEDQFMRREFNYTSFTRSFQLPETVNAEAIAANYKNGVLSVTLPKLEEMKGEPVKKIEIK
jgi:HSP20 family protein